MKILYTTILASILLSASTFSQTPQTWTFTAADYDSLNESGDWGKPSGAPVGQFFNVRSNQIEANSAISVGVSCYSVMDSATVTRASADGTLIQVTIGRVGNEGASTSSSFFLNTRMTSLSFSGANGYRARFQKTGTSTFIATIREMTGWNGLTETILATSSEFTLAANDTIKFYARNDASGTLELYKNSTLLASGASLTYVPGNSTNFFVGINSRVSNTSWRFDNFRIDTIARPAPSVRDTIAPTIRSFTHSPFVADSSQLVSFFASLLDSLTPSHGLDSARIDTQGTGASGKYYGIRFGDTKDTSFTTPSRKWFPGTYTYTLYVRDDSLNSTTQTNTMVINVATTTTTGQEIWGYYPAFWYDPFWTSPLVVPYSKLTHLLYFGLAPVDGSPWFLTSTSDGPLGAAAIAGLRDSMHANGGKFIPGLVADISHTTYVAALNAIAIDSTKSEAATTAWANYVSSINADGFEIDWEYPSTAARGYPAQRLLRMLREKLDAIRPGLLLVCAVDPINGPFSGGSFSAREWMTSTAKTYVDRALLMWYEMSAYRGGETTLGYSDGGINRPSACWQNYVMSDSINPFTTYFSGAKGHNGLGWPMTKIVIGIGFYPHVYQRAGTTPFQPCEPAANWTRLGYARMDQMFQAYPPSVQVENWDATAKVHYYTNTSGGSTRFFSYPTPTSIAEKADYMRTLGVRGHMIWDVGAAYINPNRVPNWTQYGGDRWYLLTALKSAAGSIDPVPTLPTAPTLVSPSNAATDVPVSPIFTFNKSTGATGYDLNLSTTSTFSNIVFSYSSPVSTGNDTVITTSPSTVLPQNVTHYWRVRAKNSVGAGAWSSSRSFTTAQAVVDTPTAPTLVSPSNNATSQSTQITFRWSKNATYTGPTTGWTIQVAADSPMTNFITNGFVSDTFYTVSGLPRGSKRYWRVRGINGAVNGSFSSIYNFTTATDSPLVIPAGGNLWRDPITGKWSSGLQPYIKMRNTTEAQRPDPSTLSAEEAIVFPGGYATLSEGNVYFNSGLGSPTNDKMTGQEIVDSIDAYPRTIAGDHTFTGQVGFAGDVGLTGGLFYTGSTVQGLVPTSGATTGDVPVWNGTGITWADTASVLSRTYTGDAVHDTVKAPLIVIADTVIKYRNGGVSIGRIVGGSTFFGMEDASSNNFIGWEGDSLTYYVINGNGSFHMTTETAGTQDPIWNLKQGRTTTTNGSATTIATIAQTASVIKSYRVYVTAHRTGGSSGSADDAGFYGKAGAFRLVSGAADTVGTPVDIFADMEDQAGWGVSWAVSGANLLIQVTGATNNNISWYWEIHSSKAAD